MVRMGAELSELSGFPYDGSPVENFLEQGASKRPGHSKTGQYRCLPRLSQRPRGSTCPIQGTC